VLTHKIAYLVARGMPQWKILAVTFTNKAAREMAGRVEQLLGIPAKGLWIGTFHGMCVRILRREAGSWGIKPDFTIYDRDDQIAMVKRALAKLGIRKERLAPQKLLAVIGKAKNDGLSPDAFEDCVSGRDADLMAKGYRLYNEFMREAGAFDFDDLLLTPVVKFQEHPESLEEWRGRFLHVLVDEYQDTNHTQYLLMKQLSGESGAVTAVGDDDQSIYSWRGANIKNILDFEKDFPDARIVRLEDNYRSTSFILRAANAVVKNNRARMDKELRTSRAGGAKVRLIEAWDDRDESDKVIASITKERDAFQLGLRDFVVLYRTNAQSRSFEDTLRRRGMPYVIVGGVRFYEREEIKDILAYLRFAANPADTVAFGRAIANPRRGIGPKTIETIEQYAAGSRISLHDALAKAGEYLSGVMRTHAEQFSGIIEAVKAMRGEKKGLDEIARLVIDRTDYLRHLESEHPESIEERSGNLDELVAALGEFENTTEQDDLTAFLAEVSLVSDVDTWDDASEAVTLMTLHAAKGLEFASVYIAGVENGLFPLPRTFDNEADLEEERRLFYVGITRAKDLLHVSFARQRLRYGSFGGGASMFIHELPFDALEYDKPAESRPELAPSKKRAPLRRIMEFEDYSQDVPELDESCPWHVGEFVRSPRFGRGRITNISGKGDNLTLAIQFGAKEVKIVAKYGKLEKD
jgi:DNA helicase II / ATP-dependent DNA helicase PcrA